MLPTKLLAGLAVCVFLSACTRDPSRQASTITHTPSLLPTHTALVPLNETATAVFVQYQPTAIPQILKIQTALTPLRETAAPNLTATWRENQARRVLVANILYDHLAIQDIERIYGGGDIDSLEFLDDRRTLRIAYSYWIYRLRDARELRTQVLDGLARAVCDIRSAGFTDYALSIYVAFRVQNSDERDTKEFRISRSELQQLNCDSPTLNRIWTTWR